MKTGFSAERYLEVQTKEIKDRVARFGEKLYLEFGGKLCHDFHATRVLPGYESDTKIKVLKALGDEVEIIYCVSARDIQKGRMRHDFGLPYDKQVMKDIEDLNKRGLRIKKINISLFSGEEAATRFKRKMTNFGYEVFMQPVIEGYPTDINKVVSSEGYGRMEYIPTEKPIVVITGAGGNSGKMALCLSQMYHDTKDGMDSGYAKFETFPIWNLDIDHPVNIAYEAATADLGDTNLIDQFHLKAYGETAVNYNRDIENFEIMKSIMERIVSNDNHVRGYKSPTDMGVNMAGYAITDDNACRESAKQEVIRRYFRYKKEFFLGIETGDTVERIDAIMKRLNLEPQERRTVEPARKAAEDAKRNGKGNKGIYCGSAVQLPDGSIVTGKNSPLLHAESAVIINAIKALAGVEDSTDLIPPEVIKRVNMLKRDVLKGASESLNLNEALVALAISAKYNPDTEKCVRTLGMLNNCDMHLTHLPSEGDEAGLIKLRMNVTTDANIPLKDDEIMDSS
ncbi:MAG: DUF1846 family protein [Candidatus Woesearchaeota archaeon]